MSWPYLFSVFVHVVAAIVWVGGMLVFGVVAFPVMRATDRPAAEKFALMGAMGKRFRGFSHGALTLLVITGLVNLGARNVGLDVLAQKEFWHSSFGWALRHKLEVGVIAIVLSILHDVWGSRAARLGDAPGSESLRKRVGWTGRAALLLALFTVFFAVVLVRGRP
jgi:uncharacterized membrane protein